MTTVDMRGSSPQVRGALALNLDCILANGIIPAGTGSTRRPRPRPARAWDHPRRCGEHIPPLTQPTQLLGSSPQVRGALVAVPLVGEQGGITPAGAGSTRTSRIRLTSAGDHPRRCGEHLEGKLQNRRVLGSSPQVRGAPSKHIPFETPPGDHPRRCGEHINTSLRAGMAAGSSPQVRGAPELVQHRPVIGGIIPAGAGSTRGLGCRQGHVGDHPRRCGEHTRRALPQSSPPGSSPQVRGAHRRREHLQAFRGIIPAGAGSTTSGTTSRRRGRDHPRRCGEHSMKRAMSSPIWGSSPQVRGAPCGRRRTRASFRDHPRRCGEHRGLRLLNR